MQVLLIPNLGLWLNLRRDPDAPITVGAISAVLHGQFQHLDTGYIHVRFPQLVVFDQRRAQQFATVTPHHEDDRTIVAILYTVGGPEACPFSIQLQLVFRRSMGE